MLSESERSAILEREISRYTALGFRITARSATTAQMIKPKEFRTGLAVLGALLLLIGLLVYLLIYLGQRDTVVSISVDAQGRVSTSASGGVAIPGSVPAFRQTDGRLLCPRCAALNSAGQSQCSVCRATFQPSGRVLHTA